MKITPLQITKKNITEAYNNRSILYSLLAPSVIMCAAYSIIGTESIVGNSNFGIILGLAFVFGSFNDAFISLAQEREKGTLARLILSPISRWSITGGRILSSLLFSILSSTLVLSLGILIGLIKVVPFGSDLYLVALFYVTSSLITLLTVTMSLLCSSICSSLRSTILLTLSLYIILAILPLFNQNETALTYSPYNPFGNGYQVFNWIFLGKDFTILVKEFPIQQLIVQMSVVIIFLFTAANIAFRSKIA